MTFEVLRLTCSLCKIMTFEFVKVLSQLVVNECMRLRKSLRVMVEVIGLD